MIRSGSDLGGGSDQHGNDEICFGIRDCPEQRAGIDRMNHGGPNRLQVRRLPDDVLVMVAALAKIKRCFIDSQTDNRCVRANIRITRS
jgi:hypothetical protein